MKRQLIAVLLAAVLVACCATGPDPELATLRCGTPYEAGSFVGFHSFAGGELPLPPDPDRVDLVYYFDGDDCRQGALMGRDDRPGFLFPVGRRAWSELAGLTSPSEDDESVAGIMPLSKDKQGLAFWVKTGAGEYVLARILSVEPVSYPDLVAGVVPTLELEWQRPRLRGADRP